jgi:hypothetical protein
MARPARAPHRGPFFFYSFVAVAHPELPSETSCEVEQMELECRPKDFLTAFSMIRDRWTLCRRRVIYWNAPQPKMAQMGNPICRKLVATPSSEFFS